MMTRTLFASLALVAAASLSGCATTGQIDELKSQVAAAQASADRAAAMAEAAALDAAEAKTLAAEANATAEAAKAQSADTEEKIDRMFKKAMYK